MNKNERHAEGTRELLIKHYRDYPKMKPSDIFKYIFQSALGCEHLVADEETARERINREYEALTANTEPLVEQLDGEYSRVHLSCMSEGLSSKTLARLFLLSAKHTIDPKAALSQKLQIAKELVASGDLPFEKDDFGKLADEWESSDFPAVRHSTEFHNEYHPAYRVISTGFTAFLPLFTQIDKLSARGTTVVAIEGGSASGKTTLGDILKQVYDCNVLHMDDFFLRPEQRTPERFAEIGGNVDRERFYDEVIKPLVNNETIRYRPFDCSTQALKEPITLPKKKLTIVEGVYSTHPAFGKYFDLSVFLDISPETQEKRIRIRNTPKLAERFFSEWIPLENRYFSSLNVKECSDLIFSVR